MKRFQRQQCLGGQPGHYGKHWCVTSTPTGIAAPTKKLFTMGPILQTFSKGKKAISHIIRRVMPWPSWGSAPALEVLTHDV